MLRISKWMKKSRLFDMIRQITITLIIHFTYGNMIDIDTVWGNAILEGIFGINSSCELPHVYNIQLHIMYSCHAHPRRYFSKHLKIKKNKILVIKNWKKIKRITNY